MRLVTLITILANIIVNCCYEYLISVLLKSKPLMNESPKEKEEKSLFNFERKSLV
jgi:hypothetical protein